MAGRVAAAPWLSVLGLVLLLAVVTGLAMARVPLWHVTSLEVFATGFEEPVVMLPLSDRFLVGERRGLVRVVGQREPLLDLRHKVETGYWEQGLIGLAADEDRLFVHYSRAGDGATVIEAYPLDGGTPAHVLTVPQPSVRHNGGQLVFGPDGYLYIGLGDGGDVGLSFGRGQSTDDLLGSILRVDVSERDGYAIPPDNPFVGTAGHRPELWAIGLRNPWQFSFDRATNDLYIADVGYASSEEINRQPAGHGGMNFGWAMYEGTVCQAFQGESCDRAGVTMPIVEYSHDGGQCAVIGGYAYRGDSIPELYGHYIFGDYCSGWIWSLPTKNVAATPRPIMDTDIKISAFAQDVDGELYVLSHDQGVIYRLAPDS